MRTLRTVRADYNDLPPARQLALVEDAIALIEAKEPENRTANEREDLQQLRDERNDLNINIARAQQANPYIVRGATIPCPRCGHAVALPKEKTA
jgi:hypothetical protein